MLNHGRRNHGDGGGKKKEEKSTIPCWLLYPLLNLRASEDNPPDPPYQSIGK